MTQLTQERLLALFSYDPITGELHWKISPRARRSVGDLAGSQDYRGYVNVKIDYNTYLAHRLIWLLVHGHWPGEIDHINGVRSDNRLVNLRSVSHGENMSNAKLNRRNTTGFKGVYPHGDRFAARITNSYGRRFLGYHNTIQEAVQAIEKFKAR